MGKCKDCKDWSQDVSRSDELGAAQLDLGRPAPIEQGYGRCVSNGDGKAMSRYDGGWNGELLTHGDFGCNQFKAK